MLLCNLSNFLEWEDGKIRIAQCFTIDDLCVGFNGGFEVFRVGWVDKSDFYTELGKRVLKLVVSTAI